MTGGLLAFVLAAAAPAPAQLLGSAFLATSTLTLADGKVLTVEVAASGAEREQGLMYRVALPADWGMLFVFENEQTLPFWMKNTWMDLDIIFLAADGSVTKVASRVRRSTPGMTDDEVARAEGWGRYVLELPAGAAARYGIRKGQRLRSPAIQAGRPR